MKTFYVKYEHRTEPNIRGYVVIAEDIEIAEEVGKENLEEDEANWDPDPSHWTVHSACLLEVCDGCGGLREVTKPKGKGAISQCL